MTSSAIQMSHDTWTESDQNTYFDKAIIPSKVESFLSSDQIKVINHKLSLLNENSHSRLIKQLSDLDKEAKAVGYSLFEMSEAFLDMINDLKIEENTPKESNKIETSPADFLDFLSANQINKLISLTETLSTTQEKELTSLLDEIDLSHDNTKLINNKIIGIFASISGEDLSDLMLI